MSKERDVLKRLGIDSRVTLWKWRKTRNFPQPVQLGSRCNRYFDDEVERWIENQPRAH
jgi:predicted DNA-binding transcriptional regulator AlpA